MDIITDFASLGKIARLKALEGRPQDPVVAGIAKAGPVNCQKHALPNCSVCRIEAGGGGDLLASNNLDDLLCLTAEPAEGWHVYWQNALYGVTDTAPSEYSPPDWDGA